jgi:hypothetical protein
MVGATFNIAHADAAQGVGDEHQRQVGHAEGLGLRGAESDKGFGAQ